MNYKLFSIFLSLNLPDFGKIQSLDGSNVSIFGELNSLVSSFLGQSGWQNKGIVTRHTYGNMPEIITQR